MASAQDQCYYSGYSDFYLITTGSKDGGAFLSLSTFLFPNIQVLVLMVHGTEDACAKIHPTPPTKL